MIIGAATHSDANTLAALARATYAAAFGHSMAASDLAAHLERHLSQEQIERMLAADTFLVAEADERMIGFVQFGSADLAPELASDADQELRRLYVLAAFQNQNVGTRLMHAALEHPRLQNAERIVLDVWEHNHGARRFYERHGFAVIGEQSFVVESGAETSRDLIMVRRVNE